MSFTYYDDCFQVTAKRLLTAALMLSTNDVNQNEFTAFSSAPSCAPKEN